jgi:uncharacterized protein (TIGR02421 family)
VSQSEKAHLIKISDQLYKASQSIRILRNITWHPSVREDFFAKREPSLPQVEYPVIEIADTLEQVKKARKLIGQGSRFENWANGIADKLENSAYLLQNLGKPAFFDFSTKLYGAPKHLLPDDKSNSLDLASHFETMYVNIEKLDIDVAGRSDLPASAVQARMKKEVKDMFGEDAPEVIIDKEVSSKAIAGRRRIRIRESALFSDMDIDQLVHHEAFIHVATSINGHHQPHLKILAASHPGTTKTQEGLAVFAEFITGHLDLDRLRRLSDRIIAIQMAIDGADFIEVYRYYSTKNARKEDAFENTRRVFRGGVITGGAPFTKDIVYLDGLLNVHNFLRTVVSEGRADLLPLLFVGKLDIEDMAELVQFKKMGLLNEPKYVPPWIKDVRFLLTYLAYSSFLNSVKLKNMKEHYQKMIYEL